MFTKLSIPFQKYTCCGNTFIIVDESMISFKHNDGYSLFSKWVLDRNFGIGGADNLLFLKKMDLGEHYYTDYSFRIFEQDGSETLFCGNGLLSITDLLYRLSGCLKFKILTRLPLSTPVSVETGIDDSEIGARWVNLGTPSVAPTNIYMGEDTILSLKICDSGNIAPLNAHFVFNGEPHLVFLSEYGFPSELEEMIWKNSEDSISFFHTIGEYINKKYCALFPNGVHINFARINLHRKMLEYRTYERAINCETLACGSGASAIAWTYWENNFISEKVIEIQPYRCAWYRSDAFLRVSKTTKGIILYGFPELVYKGEMLWNQI